METVKRLLKKRFFALVASAALFASFEASATAMGPQLDVQSGFLFNWGLSSGLSKHVAAGLSASAKFGAMPLYWTFSLSYGNASYKHKDNGATLTRGAELIELGVAADYWIMNPEIVGVWHWFWGFGGAALGAFALDGGNTYLATGPRAVAGMNWFLNDGFLELYAQQAVQPMLQFAFGEDGSENGVVRASLYFPFAVGLRFWF